MSENWQVSSPGVFTCGTSTVLLNSATGTRSVTPGISPFFNLQVNTGGTYRISNNTQINNNLNIQLGNLDVSVSPTYNIAIGGNWTNNGLFVPELGTITFNGANQTITKPAGELFYKFVATNNTQLNLASDVSVSNDLALNNAIITTGSNTLSSGTSTITPGSFTYTAGKIIGKFQRWITAVNTYRFPMGILSTINIADVTVNNGFIAGSLVMEYKPVDPGIIGLPLSESTLTFIGTFSEGYWNATAKNGLLLGNYNLALQGNGFISNSFNDQTRIVRRNNGGAWTLDGTHVNAISPWAYRNAQTSPISTMGTQLGLAYMDCKGGQVISSVSDICKNNDVPAFTNSALPQGGNNAFTYTWQLTTNATAVPGDASWIDISPSNAASYDYGTLSQPTRFVRRATSTGCNASKYSNILNIDVNLIPLTGKLYKIPN